MQNSNILRGLCVVFFLLGTCLEGRFFRLFSREERQIWSQASGAGLVFCIKGWVAFQARLEVRGCCKGKVKKKGAEYGLVRAFMTSGTSCVPCWLLSLLLCRIEQSKEDLTCQNSQQVSTLEVRSPLSYWQGRDIMLKSKYLLRKMGAYFIIKSLCVWRESVFPFWKSKYQMRKSSFYEHKGVETTCTSR